MSERGSFVTEYIYCDKCLEAAKQVLLSKNKYLCSQVLDGWSEDKPTLPIIAGKVGGLYEKEELRDFEFHFSKRLEKVICHPLRIAVLAEGGEKIFVVHPKEGKT